MIAVMWQFDVKPGREDEFEKVYGVDGEWTRLNRQARSYLGSSFLRDQNQPSRYVVIEYWSELLASEQAKPSRKKALLDIEARRSPLINAVEPLGIFTALNVPERAGPTWSQRT